MRALHATLAVLALALAGATAGVADSMDVGVTPDDLSRRLTALEAAREGDRSARAAARGRRIFADSCAACHGREGRGDGPGAADLDPPPRDLATGRFRFRTTVSGERPLPGDLEQTIRRGLPGSSMPAFGEVFSPGEIADLVSFVLALSAREDAPVAARIPEEVPEANGASLVEGRAIYLLSGCASCHGFDGAGRGPAARGLSDTEGRPIRATDFVHDPMKGGRDTRSIVRTLYTGLNGAPMPAYDAALLFAREDLADTSAIATQVSATERARIEEFLFTLPTRDDLDALGEGARVELLDRRAASLAHYVLSLERRAGATFRLFRQEPEREARDEPGAGTPGRKE